MATNNDAQVRSRQYVHISNVARHYAGWAILYLINSYQQDARTQSDLDAIDALTDEVIRRSNGAA